MLQSLQCGHFSGTQTVGRVVPLTATPLTEEQVDGIDASRYGPKAAAEIRLARKEPAGAPELPGRRARPQEILVGGLERLIMVNISG